MSTQPICSFCHEPYEPPAGGPGEIPVCRDCFYQGKHHEARLAPFLEALHAEYLNTFVEHTGGGCFWIAARLEDGRLVAFTDAWQDKDNGEWLTDAALPEKPEGPWYGVLYANEDAEETTATGVPLNMAEAAAFLATAIQAGKA